MYWPLLSKCPCTHSVWFLLWKTSDENISAGLMFYLYRWGFGKAGALFWQREVTGQPADIFVSSWPDFLLVLVKDSTTSHSNHDGPEQLISISLHPALTPMISELYSSKAYEKIWSFCSQIPHKVKFMVYPVNKGHYFHLKGVVMTRYDFLLKIESFAVSGNMSCRQYFWQQFWLKKIMQKKKRKLSLLIKYLSDLAHYLVNFSHTTLDFFAHLQSC